MAKLVPVQGNPFGDSQKLTPVEGNPFESSPQSAPATPKESQGLQGVIDEMGPLERVLVGIGKGFVDVGQGAKQIGLSAGEKLGVLPQGRAEEYTRQIAEEEATYDRPLLDQSIAANVGRFIGNVAATAPIPGGVGGRLITKAGAGAGAGALAGALMPTKPGESRAANIVAGGVTGGIAAPAVSALGRGVRAIRGNQSAPVAQELAEQSRTFGVPLTVGELRQSPQFQRIEQLLERVPVVGTKGFREGQSSSLGRAAQALVNQFEQGVGDIGEEVQGSLSRSLAQNKAAASQLYDAVGEAAQSASGPVQLSNLRQTIQNIVGREGQLPGPIQDSKILSAVARYGEIEDLPFDVARTVRSRLGQELRRAEKQAVSGSASDEEVAALKMIRGAFERDLDDFAAREGGDIGDLYRQANAFYRSNVVPFKDRLIRKAGSDDFDTDQIVQTFVKNDRPQLAAKLMNQLDPRGRTAVKYAVLKDAFENASDSKVPFSPAKFAARLERLGKSKNTIFDPLERKQIDGFVKLSRAAERAGQYAENPPTGMRVIDAAILGGAGAGAVFNPQAVLLSGAAAGTLSKLLTSDVGRKLLTRASGLPPESQALRRLLTTDLPRALAIQAARGGENGRTQEGN